MGNQKNRGKVHQIVYCFYTKYTVASFDRFLFRGGTSFQIGRTRMRFVNLRRHSCGAWHSSSDKYTCHKLMSFPCFYIVQLYCKWPSLTKNKTLIRNMTLETYFLKKCDVTHNYICLLYSVHLILLIKQRISSLT